MLTNQEAQDICVLAKGFDGKPVAAVERTRWDPVQAPVKIKGMGGPAAACFI